MSRTRPAIAAALLIAGLVLTGCAGAEPEAPADTQPVDEAPADTTDAGEDSGESDESDDPATAAGELIGMVGTADDPEAYEIALLDGDGNPVTSLPAGDYTLTFADQSQMHNFRLTGEGVDEATDVAGTDETTVEITLVAGTYEFVCDPHVSTMSGQLEVTG
ncbi:plastocyanin/azurin family copper-binding protein [Agrococcus sp. ARC_14]|uniref:plastocyanin/azurin family copper-binding protein n=1 Tax=Agrococcus sp. ARC_14 TaxID=2919927 RepID=UPI001F06BD5C|nr:plastocyanin/azurin family copper-binding protein [Agrococcus sp. ARC_14]MCH1883279.1 cupredoxin domain-containing protein [Agrococcus sp. ARC_14]